MNGGKKRKRNRGMWRKMEEEKLTVKTSLATEVMAVRIILELWWGGFGCCLVHENWIRSSKEK